MLAAKLNAPYTWAYPTPGIRLDTNASSVMTGATKAAVHRFSNANAATNMAKFARIVTAIQAGTERSRQMNVTHSVPM